MMMVMMMCCMRFCVCVAVCNVPRPILLCRVCNYPAGKPVEQGYVMPSTMCLVLCIGYCRDAPFRLRVLGVCVRRGAPLAYP